MKDNKFSPKQVRRMIRRFFEVKGISRMQVAEIVDIFMKNGIEGDCTSGNVSWMANSKSLYKFFYDKKTEELCKIN